MNNKYVTLYDSTLNFVDVLCDQKRFPRLREMGEAAYPQVRAMIVGAAILRNAPMTEERIDITAGAFLAEVAQDYPTLTLPEIGYAIREGCFEKYGEVYGISPASLYKMVAAYVASEEANETRRQAAARRDNDNEKTRKWLEDHPFYKTPKYADSNNS